MVSPWWISPILWRIFALLVSCVGVPEYILSLHCTTGRKTGSRHIGIGWEKTSPCLAATVNLENQNWRWKLQTVSWRNVFRMNCVSSCRIEGVWVFYCGWPQVSRFSADGGQEWKTRLEAGERKGEIERRAVANKGQEELERLEDFWEEWKMFYFDIFFLRHNKCWGLRLLCDDLGDNLFSGKCQEGRLQLRVKRMVWRGLAGFCSQSKVALCAHRTVAPAIWLDSREPSQQWLYYIFT